MTIPPDHLSHSTASMFKLRQVQIQVQILVQIQVQILVQTLVPILLSPPSLPMRV